MSTREFLLTKNEKIAGIAIGTLALLTVSAPTLMSAEAPNKDEVFKVTTAIQIPGIKALTSFDISYDDPVLKVYLLADRNAAAIDIVDTTNNSITQSAFKKFCGVSGCVAAGPNGVWTVNNKEIWAGDGDSTLKVLDASGALLHTIDTKGTMRVDEGCFDPRDQLVAAANDNDTPPFISFIATSGPKAYTVVGKIVYDGTKGTVKATNGMEQCKWDPETGKFYLNIPEVNGPGDDSKPGAVSVIDPKTLKVEKNFSIPLDDCTGPMGMAIGPHNQILLGCSANGSNSAIINAHSGAVERVLKGYAGTDEVWFNRGDGHYILPFCPAGCRTDPPTVAERIGFIDADGFRPDQSVFIALKTTTAGTGGGRRAKSVAADPHKNQVYVPIAGIGGGAPTFAPTICSSAPTKVGKPTDDTGCIAVFTTTHDDRRLVRHEHDEDEHNEK